MTLGFRFSFLVLEVFLVVDLAGVFFVAFLAGAVFLAGVFVAGLVVWGLVVLAGFAGVLAGADFDVFCGLAVFCWFLAAGALVDSAPKAIEGMTNAKNTKI